MFKELIEEVSKKEMKLIDKVTKILIVKTGVILPENPSSFECLMIQDDLKRNGYRLAMEQNKICLYRIEDLHDELICGYEIKVKVENLSVSIIAEPITVKFAPNI